MAHSGERRNRIRIAVRWPVRLFRRAGRLVESSTENVSSEGLYCIVKTPFKIGESLNCEILIPGKRVGLNEESVRLQCHITVRRVEIVPEGYGMGCHIDDYSVLTNLA